MTGNQRDGVLKKAGRAVRTRFRCDPSEGERESRMDRSILGCRAISGRFGKVLQPKSADKGLPISQEQVCLVSLLHFICRKGSWRHDLSAVRDGFQSTASGAPGHLCCTLTAFLGVI